VRRERLKGNTDDDEVAEQPAEKIKLEEVENKANDQVGQQVGLYSVSQKNFEIWHDDVKCVPELHAC